ncbi:MAG: GDSL-type esterase/lipase family protein, partial [Brevibacterium linens]
MSSDITTTIAVVGGPLVAGHGDGRGLGWVGRVTARTLPSVPELKVYPLAVPTEDSAGLHARTIAEASLRFTPD